MYKYDAFGNEIKKDKKDDNPFRYAREYYDSETGNIYLRARYYAPGLGRFLTRDTYTGEEDDPLSLHLYTYCDNDGVNQIDPSGHWGKKDGFGYKGDKYVHKSITMEALSAYRQIKTTKRTSKHSKFDFKYIFGINKKEKYLLDGSILPDYLQATKDNQNKYVDIFQDEYDKYSTKKLLGIRLWNKDNKDKYKNTFHGKSKKRLKNLKKRAYPNLLCAGHNKERYLLLGCVLHSIQDYSAHSYYGDLEKFKKYLQKHHKAPKDQKKRVFHADWYYNKKKKDIDNNSRFHTQTKDDPYMDVVGSHGVWVWQDVGSEKNNKRYVKSVRDSIIYLKYLK